MNDKHKKNMKYFKLERLEKGVVFIFLAVFLSAALMGCQALEKKALREKNQIEIEKRKDDIETYLLDYLTKKYHEKFISHGLINSNVAWDMADKSGAMLEFHMEAVESGINIKPAYSGAYIFPDSGVLIDDYRYLVDGDYWIDKLEHDFTEREEGIISKFFPGYKPRLSTFFRMSDSPFNSDFYRAQEVLEPKFLDVEYYLSDEKDKLEEYNFNMEYFKDINAITKDDFLENVYNFILYTRSLGFKHCSIDINIFDEKLKDSDLYKQYLVDDEGVNLMLYFNSKGIKTKNVFLTIEEVNEISTLQDLIDMNEIHDMGNN